MTQTPSSLLLVGSGPLPSEKRNGGNAGGLRTEQFLRSIPEGFDVSIFVVENEEYKGIKTKKEVRQLRHVSVSRHDPNIFRHLRQFYWRNSPTCVVGVNFFPCYLASCQIPKHVPFWADMNGWAMAEKQAQAFALQTNDYIPLAKKMEKEILVRADKVSVVSKAQKYAVYGEMAMIGLLTKDSFRHPFVEVIENSCRPLSSEETLAEKHFRGRVCPEDAIIAVWIGGMNAWADEKTLFEACELVMAKVSNFYFFMTGTDLLGIDEESYPRFQKRVKKSRFHDRFHLLGWIPYEHVPSLLREADMGINVDRMCAETEVGARNRINEMLRYELPIVTTMGSEIAEIVGQSGAGLTCESGESREIANAIEKLCQDKNLQKRCIVAGQTLIKTRFSDTLLQRDFCAWLKNPTHSPKAMLKKKGVFSVGLSYLRHRGIRAFWGRVLREVYSRFS